MVNFDIPNGYSPEAALVLSSNGDFYGTTSRGGGSDGGTVFKMTSSGTLTTLVRFTGINGKYPSAALIQGANGNFYGTTFLGGRFSDIYNNSYGTVFQMTPSGTLTTIVNFDGNNGRHPSGPLVQDGDGNFLGTTQYGGSSVNLNSSSGYGTVFKMTPGGNLTTLVNFTRINGALPLRTALVKGIDGNFYGTTFHGGSFGYGTVFRMSPTGSLTTLVNFAVATSSNPNTLVLGQGSWQAELRSLTRPRTELFV